MGENVVYSRTANIGFFGLWRSFVSHLWSCFSLHLQVLSSEEESKRKAQGLLPSPPALGNTNGVQVVTGGTNLTSAAVTSQENHNPGAADIHVSTDLEEGELDFARTPSPPVQTTPAHSSSHGVHPSLGPSLLPAPLLGRQPHLTQVKAYVSLSHQSSRALIECWTKKT